MQAPFYLLSLQTLIERNTSIQLTGNQIKKLTLDELKNLLIDKNVLLARQSNLQVMQFIDQKVVEIESSILKQSRLEKSFIKLLTVDGIGKILALTITLETEDINRFAKVSHYASYCRCIDSKKTKTTRLIAIKAIAHKLSRACFYMMKDRVDFDVNKSFR